MQHLCNRLMKVVYSIYLYGRFFWNGEDLDLNRMVWWVRQAGGFAVIFLFSTERQLLMKYLVILHACDFQALLFWTATDRETLVCWTITKQTLVHLVRMGQRFLQMFWFFNVGTLLLLCWTRWSGSSMLTLNFSSRDFRSLDNRICDSSSFCCMLSGWTGCWNGLSA